MAIMNDEDLDRDMTIDLLSQGPSRDTRARRRGQPYEQGGVTGNVPTALDDGIAPAPPDPAAPPSTTPPPENPRPPAQTYNMRGFDAGKMSADPTQQSERYLIGNVMKKYDPKGGVTPEMLAELNALGIAEFSGSGGNLTVKNTKNDPRFGTGGTADVVYGYDGQNQDTAWQPWLIDDGAGGGAMAPQGGGTGMMSAGGGGSAFNSLAPMDNDFFRRLQEKAQQLLGGAGAMDRDALLRMLEAK